MAHKAKKGTAKEDHIWQLVDNRWLFEMRKDGRNSVRYRRLFDTKAEAVAHKKIILNKSFNGEEISTKSDDRHLSDLAQSWYDVHGYSLSSGYNVFTVLKKTISNMGDKLAVNSKPMDFIEHRKRRSELQGEDGKRKISDNHLNHELVYLKSMFNKLIELGIWKLENPYGTVKKLALDENELSYLTLAQVKALLDVCQDESVNNIDLIHIVRICLSTGCRFGEALGLTANHVRHGQIHFSKTKTKKNRSVPIDSVLEEQLKCLRSSGRLFQKGAWVAFRLAIDRANIILPKGQLTHVLRHTFASHFVMNDGNILKLNKILGHKTIQMTMRYAHLAPGHLEEAKMLNPISCLGSAENSNI